MAESKIIGIRRGIITSDKNIELLSERMYNNNSNSEWYTFRSNEVYFESMSSSIMRADIETWRSGKFSVFGNDTSKNRLSDAYFPTGLNPKQLGIILIDGISKDIEPKTFNQNKDLLNCMLEHHYSFFEKHKDVLEILESIKSEDILIGRIEGIENL
ncbi:MAG: hypothetical protein WCX73_05560 [Candidatus Pacearchaeota archaeon]